MPENKFLSSDFGEYVISVFHHPIDWLSPNTKNNNKSRFEEHLISSSNLVLFGHEHDKGKSKNISQKETSVIFCGGKALQKNVMKESGFSFYEIDLEAKTTKIKVYRWDQDKYTIDFEDTHSIHEKTKRKFSLSNEFGRKITNLSIPLKHPKKEKLLLSDVFIYPDLEPIDDEQNNLQYPNSKELISLIKEIVSEIMPLGSSSGSI